ncbi:MAG: HPr(Ser) kinase/phosphatase [Ruminococcaceae bacterium]|nr:HPr(Ser) kinase/phosphatase [Oscillospiraceae bacterium]
MGKEVFSVTLGELIDEFKLEKIWYSSDMKDKKIVSNNVNRPGLEIIGFFEDFDVERIQIFGKVEYNYLRTLTSRQRLESFDQLFATGVPAVVITRQQQIFPELYVAARKYQMPLFRTAESTSSFLAALIAYLNNVLAPRITRHGVLVEIYGEGVLILGESGIGKSETAIELVKRGHRLVADDAVEIKRVSAKSLVGSAPAVIRHFIELRGIGIVDVKRIFGMGAVKDTEKINMVVQLEEWDMQKVYDRLGMENEYINILGLDIPSLKIPVRPGRNLAVILEVAAMNNRQKRMGYNAAKTLNDRLMAGINDAEF